MNAISAQFRTDRSQSAERSAAREEQPDLAGPIAAQSHETGSTLAVPDDFSREIYCLLGIPVDAIEMADAVGLLERAAAARRRFLLSTPNLNFLVTSYRDREFRDSLWISDLCPADGMAIVWIARFVGVPIKARIAGSDIFEALKMPRSTGRRLRVFFFGGNDGVASAASAALNGRGGGLYCVGAVFPGFGSVEDMSRSETIDGINASQADFLVAALGARKGQAWLRRNHSALQVPVRAHLGAAINFEAGTVRRAPAWIRRSGFEWLWRIREEPRLWRRYVDDAFVFFYLSWSQAIPLAVETRWARIRSRLEPQRLCLMQEQFEDHVMLHVAGDALGRYVPEAIPCMRSAATTTKDVVVDLSRTRLLDARFLGLLLMLTKQLAFKGKTVTFIGVYPSLGRTFRRHGAGFLLAPLS